MRWYRIGIRKAIRRITKDTRARIETKIIELAIGVFIAAAILPEAVTQWFGANKTSWTNPASVMWDVGGLLIVVGAVIAFYIVATRD